MCNLSGPEFSAVRQNIFHMYRSALDRRRPGNTNSENCDFDLPLLPAFRIFDFVLDRRRPGKVKS